MRLVLALALVLLLAACGGGSDPDDDRSFEGPWTGRTDPGSSILELSFRVVPGENRDTDPWLFETLFPLGVLFGMPQITCSPTAIDGGWRLTSCSGLPPNSSFEATVKLDPVRIEVRSSVPPFDQPDATLTKVALTDEPQASGNVSLLWQFHGDGGDLYTDIMVEDGLVFAPRYSEQIEILDASTGNLLGIAQADAAAQSGPGPKAVLEVRSIGGFLFAATQTRGVLVFNIQNPAEPQLVRQIFSIGDMNTPDNFFNVHNIQLSARGDVLYAVNSSTPMPDLRIFSLAEPSNPVEVSRFRLDISEPMTDFHDLNLIQQDNRLIAFLNSQLRGFLVLDVTDPAAIETLASVPGNGKLSHSGWAFEIDGKLFYAHADEGFDLRITIYDVSDISTPVVISSFKTRDGISVHNLEVLD